jgi:hypothetical protein
VKLFSKKVFSRVSQKTEKSELKHLKELYQIGPKIDDMDKKRGNLLLK